MGAAVRTLLLLLLALGGNCAVAEELIATAVTKAGEAVPYVLTRLEPPPKYLLILFPGGNGIVNPRIQDGRLAYEKKGNFLLRAREHWVDDDFATIAMDATAAEDRIQAVIDDLKGRFPSARIYLIGTSKGTYDTMALAAYLADKIAGEVHTSSLSTVASFDGRKYGNRQLVVHHRSDGCKVTPFFAAEQSHTRYGTDFIAMEGGTSVGDPCEAYAYHGYNGIERETVAAIKDWIRQDPPTMKGIAK
ncbi:MAG TPA: hypothetical protein VMB75_08480 [Rhodocyclaceae bacterium]|nr:hypothetical protein [Rhodocyclaceae bacterium]